MKDLFSDGGHLFASTTLHYELPDYVLNGDTQMDKAASLEDSCFADPVSRLFPIHTRGHVFASAVYMAKQADVSPEAVEALNNRAGVFGIAEDIQKVATYVSALERRGERKVAEVASPFIIKIGTPITCKIAGAGASAVSKAASRFFDSIPDMDPKMITEAAIDLVKAADDNGVTPSADLLKYAGVGTNDEEFIADQKLLRIGLIPDPLEKRAASELIANIKTAEDLLAFDRKNGLDNFYGERLDPAHHVFHSGMDMSKVAAVSELEQISREFARDNHTYQAVAAAIGEDRAVGMLKSGSLELNDIELGLVRLYLRSQPSPAHS